MRFRITRRAACIAPPAERGLAWRAGPSFPSQGCGKGERLGNADKNLAGKTSLEEIKVILKHAFLHIDSEGGLVHLRHALKGGASCVFYGPTSPQVYGYSENISLCSNVCPIYCECYSRTWQKKCLRGKRICMESITPQYALDKIIEAKLL
ncbi:glycosyltransferase family 9 protein [Candidatus Avelusimicrobium faecicola]|uniref:glycosyltransferase family 9 protein n=1 Tax=Candidatus Avelusimicrobium faecicola TaxID=3416205 RepID=UPI003D1188E5